MPETRAKNKPELHEHSPQATDSSDNQLMLREGKKIVEALGTMLAPICEVVLHDLTRPENAILAIENPLSGRTVGAPTTEMGLARIRDPQFPDVIQNYATTFPDGRPAKSTSIGLRNSQGVCIAAICLNMDISLLETTQRLLGRMIQIDVDEAPIRETFRSRSLEDMREAARSFAADLGLNPRALSLEQRRELIASLSDAGLLQLRGAIGMLGEVLGVARSTIYNALNAGRSGSGNDVVESGSNIETD